MAVSTLMFKFTIGGYMFLETHALGEDNQVSALQAIKDAFRGIFQDVSYTFTSCISLGLLLGAAFVAIDYFEYTGSGLGIGQFFMEAIIAFHWHRYMLLAQKSGGFKSDPDAPDQKIVQKQGFRPFMWRSLGYYILLVVLTVILAFLLVPLLQQEQWVALVAISGVIAFFALMLLPRLFLIFPATALANPQNSISDMFLLSAGRSFLMARGYLGMIVIIGLVSSAILVIASFVDPAQPLSVLNIITQLLLGTLNVVIVALFAGMNSSFYAQLGGSLEDHVMARHTVT